MFQRSGNEKHGGVRRMSLLLGAALLCHASWAWSQEDNLWNSLETDDGAAADGADPESEEPGEDVAEIGNEPAEEGTLTIIESDSPVAADADDSRVQLSGYLRQSLELGYGQLARESREPSNLLWRDVFASRSQLVLRSSYLQGRSFEATVSGVLGYTLHVAKDAPQYSVGVVDLARGELDSELREAYLGFFWSAVDLRIGQQRIAWGRSDFQSPNDVLNARDLRDPFLQESELRHLPTLAVRSSFNSGPITFEAVVTPLFVPDRIEVYGSTWSILQRRAPEAYRRFVGSTSVLVDPTIQHHLNGLWRQSELPNHNGKGAAAGARLSASLSSTDISAYYHYGYDSTPFVTFNPTFQAYLFDPATDLTLNNPVGAQLDPVLALISSGERAISARYIRRHHVGLDLATTLGPIVARIDAAYETRRVFYRLDLNSFSAPALLGVFGLEYQTGRMSDVILLELLGTRLLEMPVEGQRLLAYEQTTLTVAGTLRWGLSEFWALDMRAFVAVQPETVALQPALSFKPNDSFTLKLGALVMSGTTNSFGWYYGDNDTAYLQLRYAF